MISDLADAEFPVRVEAGRLIAAGELPFWTPHIMSGSPMAVDPLSMILFALLPPALALGLLYGILLCITAAGTYTLARHLGCSRAGAFLAGFSFVWSGFFVCQMRHLGIIGTAAFFPYALYCLDRALLSLKTTSTSPSVKPQTFKWLMFFALCFGMQVLAGFPQTAYICGLFYGLLILWRLLALILVHPFRTLLTTLLTFVVGLAIATLLGALMGMCSLLPIWELGTLSDRAGGLSFNDVISISYPPQFLISFLSPYFYGDISDVSFTLRNGTLFWEVYGYAGLVTVLLAFTAIGVAVGKLRGKKQETEDERSFRTQTLFWVFVFLLSLGMVLSPFLPLYKIAFHTIPGFSSFRFPTRFLFVTVLSLTLLGGIGLTWLQATLSRLIPTTTSNRTQLLIGELIVALTIADLIYHNQRQNPMANSQEWLTATETATVIKKELGRTFSPDAYWHHMAMFAVAKGWSGDLTPYYLQRNMIQPNSNLLQGIPSLNAYAGISPSWVVDLIGDHNRFGLLLDLRSAGKLNVYHQWLQALSVKWLILSAPARPPEQPFLIDKGKTSIASYLYQIQNPLPRARFAKHLTCLPTIKDIKRESVSGRLDPTQTTLLHSQQELQNIQDLLNTWKQEQQEASRMESSVTFLGDRATEITLKASSPEGGLLVLADTYYPGWQAAIDEKNTPIYRVNMMNRGVLVPPGVHTVTFRYQSKVVQRGILLSIFGFLSIIALICYYGYKSKENPV
jgi:hypothetical protein